jgi:tetratricopeptide (TPR) repeat protein
VDRIQELEEIVDSQNDPTLAPTVTPRPSRTPGPRPTGVDIPPVSSQDETASAQFTDEGNLYNDEGDYQAAILSFNRAIELNPANVAAINNRGNAFYLNGQYQAALLDYNRALQIDPNSPIIYNNRGNANYELGDYFSALRDYDEAIYLDDRYAEAYYGRGSTYLLTEDYELALSDLGRALELGYSLPEQVYNERGLTYYAMMNNVAARADFQRSINANSEFAEAYFNLGNLEYDEENWDAALENYETYVTLTDSPEQDALDRMDELGERTGN